MSCSFVQDLLHSGAYEKDDPLVLELDRRLASLASGEGGESKASAGGRDAF
jgi:hypothetical protein